MTSIRHSLRAVTRALRRAQGERELARLSAQQLSDIGLERRALAAHEAALQAKNRLLSLQLGLMR